MTILYIISEMFKDIIYPQRWTFFDNILSNFQGDFCRGYKHNIVYLFLQVFKYDNWIMIEL